jgi:hypothetical protein
LLIRGEIIHYQGREDCERRTLQSKRQKYRKKVLKWLDDLTKVFPAVSDNSFYRDWRATLDNTPLDGMPSASPPIPSIERRHIPLPGFFTTVACVPTGLSAMAEYEELLRRGSASELLEEIRQSLIRYNWNLGKKINEVHGQAGNTRFASHLRTIHSEARESACKYRVIYDGLRLLGLPPDDELFRPLHDSELWVKSTSERERIGSKTTEDPWYWRVPMLDGDKNREAYVQEGIYLFLIHCQIDNRFS